MERRSIVRERFERNRDEEKAEKMSAYMRGKFRFYGIPAPLRKTLYRDLLREDRRAGRVDWAFLDACWDEEFREFQYLVADYLACQQNRLTFEDVPRIKRFAKIRQWWDTIDCLDRVIGNIALTDPRIDGLMLEWATDGDFWLRRLAIDHQLGRKEKTNPELLEKILVLNFGSSEFFINKAIGWSLRDYAKTDPEWVRDFLNRYRERMAPLSVREAEKHLG